jgi:hypothetical protein
MFAIMWKIDIVMQTYGFDIYLTQFVINHIDIYINYIKKNIHLYPKTYPFPNWLV